MEQARGASGDGPGGGRKAEWESARALSQVSGAGHTPVRVCEVIGDAEKSGATMTGCTGVGGCLSPHADRAQEKTALCCRDAEVGCPRLSAPGPTSLPRTGGRACRGRRRACS